ncbi:hypothetical protein [Vibrio rumoiensis]|nr:hypothetical protein [Vibrio rumoiensis]
MKVDFAKENYSAVLISCLMRGKAKKAIAEKKGNGFDFYLNG